MKLLVIGYAGHGKDAAATMLGKFLSLKYISGSRFACEEIVYPQLKSVYGYASPEDCFMDRTSHRQEWFDIIANYNSIDPMKLTKDVMKEYDIYVGMRSERELLECKRQRIFDLIIWIDASKRVGPEKSESCTVGPMMADIIIKNDFTERELAQNLRELAADMLHPMK